MRSLPRLIKIAAGGALLFWAAISDAQVNGNATISAFDPVFGPISVSTSSQFAGAVSSIKWNGKEFINNWDHGRQLQLNSQFFNRFECYNPYEAGSLFDQNFASTSSKLLSLSAIGNRLESETQMAWYLRQRESTDPRDGCGDPAHWLPCPPYNGNPVSDYRVHKTVTIGYAGIPNVIEYLVDQFIPEPILKGIDNVTAVLPYDFRSIRSYDVVSREYRNIRLLDGEDDRIKVVSSADGSYAMGFYAPELLQPYQDPGSVNFWRVVPPDPFYPDPVNPAQPDPNFACVHVGSIVHYDTFNGPGFVHDRAYLVIGNLEQVKTGLASLNVVFRAFDPEVYNWRDYVAINNLSSLTTEDAAQNHWLTQGIPQGLTASRTFSASQYLQLNPDVGSAPNYQTAIDHYVTAGRAEGRTTVSRAAAGMQHLVVFANRNVNAAGQSIFGQLGTSTPPHIASLDYSVTEVAAGDYSSFAVKNDGTLWVWGSNQYGARGDGSSGDTLTVPVQVPLPVRVTTPSRRGKHAVAVGTGVYSAIDKDGQVWTWGVNWNGRLGDGTNTSRFTPARVKKSAAPNDFLTGIVSIAAGGGTIAALDADGTIWTWGAGTNGALGNGFAADQPYPVQVMTMGPGNQGVVLPGVSQVACGSSGFCIALARNGSVYGWGNNNFSQLGITAGGSSSIAIPIAIAPNSAIAAGSAHAVAHSSNGNVYGWGYNGRGQLGIGSTGVAQAPPIAMSQGPNGMNNIADLIAGPNFSAMVRYTDRAVFVTGDNQSGQLGIPGNASMQLLPVRSNF
jgi:alpha-tubulin suppressor-like RCC1 family protein